MMILNWHDFHDFSQLTRIFSQNDLQFRQREIKHLKIVFTVFPNTEHLDILPCACLQYCQKLLTIWHFGYPCEPYSMLVRFIGNNSIQDSKLTTSNNMKKNLNYIHNTERSSIIYTYKHLTQCYNNDLLYNNEKSLIIFG